MHSKLAYIHSLNDTSDFVAGVNFLKSAFLDDLESLMSSQFLETELFHLMTFRSK